MAVVLTALLLLSGCGGPTLVPTAVPTDAAPTSTPSVVAPVRTTDTPIPDTPEPITPTADSASAPAASAVAGDQIPIVVVGGVSFPVELAETQEQLSKGLSGRDSLALGTGMLFVHETDQRYTFWMKDMRIPLDMLWIDAACTVADISAQVHPPEPEQPDRSLPLFSPERPVRHVLEINAGAASASSISIGDAVEFAGSLKGRFGC